MQAIGECLDNVREGVDRVLANGLAISEHQVDPPSIGRGGRLEVDAPDCAGPLRVRASLFKFAKVGASQGLAAEQTADWRGRRRWRRQKRGRRSRRRRRRRGARRWVRRRRRRGSGSRWRCHAWWIFLAAVEIASPIVGTAVAGQEQQGACRVGRTRWRCGRQWERYEREQLQGSRPHG